MTEKKLRRMKRAELVEVIYALQKREAELCGERDMFKRRLEERLPPNAEALENAALRLNRAMAAANQYLALIDAAAQRQARCVGDGHENA